MPPRRHKEVHVPEPVTVSPSTATDFTGVIQLKKKKKNNLRITPVLSRAVIEEGKEGQGERRGWHKGSGSQSVGSKKQGLEMMLAGISLGFWKECNL